MIAVHRFTKHTGLVLFRASPPRRPSPLQHRYNGRSNEADGYIRVVAQWLARFVRDEEASVPVHSSRPVFNLPAAHTLRFLVSDGLPINSISVNVAVS